MAVVSFRVDDDTKRKMDELSEVNWSEVLRRTVKKRIQEERRSQEKDFDRIRRACRDIDRLRQLSPVGWSGAEEIRRWRDLG